MKLKLLFVNVISLLAFQSGFSQNAALPQQGKVVKLNPAEYQSLKEQGKLDFSNGNSYEINFPKNTEPKKVKIHPSQYPAGKSLIGGNCSPFVASCSDTSTDFVPGIDFANDDGSSSLINLPFTFCLYGTSYNSCYINNNGNISFGQAVGTYSSSGFPNSTAPMVAPFWADFDTNPYDNGQGCLVKMQLSSGYLRVLYQNIGYFSSNFDKQNNCEVIITDGLDPILPPGNNCAFLYGDMQWTTGDASQGTNGFGGIPSTVGANKGDGVNFIQFGRFDHAGIDFDGPFGNPDGVSWLDNKTFIFDVCANGGSNNIAPLTSNQFSGCDTIRVCLFDTVNWQFDFFGPEQGQSVTVGLDTIGSFVPGLTVVNQSNGTTGSISLQFVSDTSNIGVHSFTINGTDDGSPNRTTSISLYVEVLNDSLPRPIILGTLGYCNNDLTTLASNNSYAEYLWSNGSTDSSVTVAAGDYSLIVAGPNGCIRKSDTITVVSSDPNVTAIGSTTGCGIDSIQVNLTYSPSGASILWEDGSTSDSRWFTNDDTLMVYVTDTLGCSDSTQFIVGVHPFPPVPVISGDNSLCNSETTTLSVSVPGMDSYIWNDLFFPLLSNVRPNVSAGNYTVTIVDNFGCSSTSANFIVTATDPNLTLVGDPELCGNGTTLAGQTTTGGPIWWSTGDTINSLAFFQNGPVTVYTSAGGCLDSITTTILLHPIPPAPIISGNTHTCFGVNTILSGPSGFTQYVWSNGNVTQSINVPAGTYSLYVVDQFTCKSDTTFITVGNSDTLVDIVGNDTICSPTQLLTLAIGDSSLNYTYLWSNGSDSSSAVMSGFPDTSFVIVTDQFGCVDTHNFLFWSFAPPVANFTIDPPFLSGTQKPVVFTDSSYVTGADDEIIGWHWNFGNQDDPNIPDDTSTVPSPTHIFADEDTGKITVQLIVTNSIGCTDTMNVEYTIANDLEFFNVMTPNGDGKNDNLVINYLIQKSPENNLKIYDRWGVKIFDKDNYRNDWNGEKFSAGTYYFVLKHKEGTKASFFTIIRD
ncbi:MAG: gliding motility-associated C-terminal domain-containing protein [Bacteroidia bacterium]|nr:gliding motility-associated C-terminal domain-containing protein [Bacteroidia bacterium]